MRDERRSKKGNLLRRDGSIDVTVTQLGHFKSYFSLLITRTFSESPNYICNDVHGDFFGRWGRRGRGYVFVAVISDFGSQGRHDTSKNSPYASIYVVTN